MSPTQGAATAAIEATARDSYGRLLAWLAWQWRDVCAAEDALSDALLAALTHWPRDGVPESPQAWLLAAARRRLLMADRRRRLEADPAVTALLPDANAAQGDEPEVPDERLRLMLVCAHPAIDTSVHAALMLQLVLGIDAARIANACLISPAALGKRLVRAKHKIRDAGLPFAPPERRDLADRTASVLEAIYGLYAIGEAASSDLRRGELAHEALYLAGLVSANLPEHPEAHGLCALMHYREARNGARIDAQGTFVPLDEQDPRRWQPDQLDAAEAHLAAALRQRQPGPYQLEAAIQAAHMQGVVTGVRRWHDIVALYQQLLTLGPTVGAQIGHALAVSHAQADATKGLTLLDAIHAPQLQNHQPWWAARARLLAMANQGEAARAAFMRASALTGDESIASWLRHQADRLSLGASC